MQPATVDLSRRRLIESVNDLVEQVDTEHVSPRTFWYDFSGHSYCLVAYLNDTSSVQHNAQSKFVFAQTGMILLERGTGWSSSVDTQK